MALVTWGISTAKAVCSALDGGLGIALVDTSNPNVILDAIVTRVGDNVGIVVRYVDADNYIYTGHDGTNAYLVKVVAGTPTTVATAAKAFGAGNVRVIISGTQIMMYWNGAQIGATFVTIGDAALQTSGKHGLITTNTGNTFDNVYCYARGD